MAYTYSATKVALDEIATRIAQNRKRLVDSRSQAATAEAELTAMQTQYQTIVTELNAAATAAPNDEAIQSQKLEKDKLVADFSALKTKATAIKEAIDGAQ